MKKTEKILFLLMISAILFLVGNFLFGHFQQNLTPSFSIAHAQDLHTDLMPKSSSQTWIFTVWNVALALANVIVIVMLLFVAIVNIVHLQYDTYAIKKSLPLLIMGIIMANFSLLICRMIVDSAQILANTFASNPKELATGLLCSIGVVSKGSKIEVMLPLMSSGLIIMIFVFILILIAVFILAFLLWFRKTVIFLLVAVAPVAFILYAFPPTQGLFKTWWSWFLKWTFMGPIVMLLVWVASVIGKTNCDVVNASGTTFSISALFATCGVLYLAAIVPFKLGGPVMGAIGKAGQWATGTGKNGYLRKPTDRFVQDHKDAYRMRANNWANTHTPLGNARAKHAMEMETLKGEDASIQKRNQATARNKLGSGQQLRDAEIANADSILEEEKTKQQLLVESGNFNHISKSQMRKITGESDPMNVAQKYVEQANSLKQTQEGLTKRRDLDLQNLSIRDLRQDTTFRQQIAATGATVTSTAFDESGADLATGAPPTTITYDRAIEVAEELRFKAKSETDKRKREKLIAASSHFENKAKEFQNTHATDAAGEKIDYKNYLSRNLSGRRMKVLNPAINDEAEVEVMGSTHTDLVNKTDDPTKTFGTSEWRAKNTDYDRHLRGEVVKDGTAAYACRVQTIATSKVMATARRGDVKGLETMELFTSRVHKAGRADFKETMAKEALKTMDDKNQKNMKDTIAKQAGHTNWAAMSGDATQETAALNSFDFKKLDITSSGSSAEGKQASANRAFIDRYLTKIESDDKLGLSSSSGVVLKKV